LVESGSIAGDALTDLFILRGAPEYIRSDNGPEFIVKKICDWIAAVGAMRERVL
jgi:putative transposase